MGALGWLGGRAAATALLATALTAPATGSNEPQGEWRGIVEWRDPSDTGPLAQANRLQPGIAVFSPSSAASEIEWRHTLRSLLAAQPMAFGINVLARHEQRAATSDLTQVRFNELHASTDAGGWSLTAGKRIVSWDIGLGFRPNDVVQQESRRTLLGTTPEGRPLLQAEHFGADSAWSLVWVNPQNWQADASDSRRADESALALRWYRRTGPADWHVFARQGRHTGASLGGAVAWVVHDEIELHGSLRLAQRHDAWRIDPAAGLQPTAASPWSLATQGAATQGLLGLTWTGAQQQSLTIEAWHDGHTLSPAQWNGWRLRNRSLAASPAPSAARAGNLAAQASPLTSANLHRDNLFARMAWQAGPWQWSVDALVHPADRGVISSANLSWQGDRWRLAASARAYGGAADSMARQLPQRHTVVTWATWSF